MKKCPFCAEEIQDEAVKCKHCASVIEKVGELRATPMATQATAADAPATGAGQALGCLISPAAVILFLAISAFTYADHGFRLYLWPWFGIVGLMAPLWVPYVVGGFGVTRAVLQGSCPYCNVALQCPADAPAMDCPACKRRILVRDQTFVQV